jgi:hypothetical protein
MGKVFGMVGLVLGLGVLAIVGTGLLLSHQWRIEADILVAASPERIHEEVENLHRWATWEAENHDDRGVTYTYEGPAVGVGATRRFTGKHGIAGYSTITQSVPGQGVWLESEVDGGSSRAVASITYRVTNGVTRVVWTDTGTLPKVTGAFLRDSVETRLKFHVQASLKRLKDRAEAPRTASP